MKVSIWCTLVITLSFSQFSFSQEEIELLEIGNIKTKSANEIEFSRWSIGGETLDRDYADYDAYKKYLGPLGAKRIRLQGGWAKCEQEKGVYDFTWLDAIVDDALAQGVQPWIQTSYGNPIYEGGGEAILAGGIPTSEEALEAWDKWVEALVTRYKSKVTEWEIWNEPDISKRFDANEFAAFHVRTVDIVRRVQPEARIIALGLAGLSRTEYVESILKILKEKGKLDQFDVLTFHGYTIRPEDNYSLISKLADLVHSYNPEIELWQGENGAPSTPLGLSTGALSKVPWSEKMQAKYVLRRMAADMGNKVDVTNVFSISDMHYAGSDHLQGLNSKGLLKADIDNSIISPKLSYYAFQNMASIFSGSIKLPEDVKINSSLPGEFAYFFTNEEIGANAIAYWFGSEKPSEFFESINVNLQLNYSRLVDPVLVDPSSGKIYELDSKNISGKNSQLEFRELPFRDWPLVIIERKWLEDKKLF